MLSVVTKETCFNSLVQLNRNFGAKLCDFGFSIIKKETQSKSTLHKFGGTLQWTAPEVNPLKSSYLTLV